MLTQGVLGFVHVKICLYHLRKDGNLVHWNISADHSHIIYKNNKGPKTEPCGTPPKICKYGLILFGIMRQTDSY